VAINTFAALKSRNYRLYFSGQSVSLIGTWMQKTAVSWVVYDLTHSKIMLGVAAFSTLFPSFLFSFLGGVVSDRYNRYRVLLLTQFISMLQAVMLATLVFTGFYNVWVIIGLGALLGFINAFDVPARQSLVYEMVEDKSRLPNALALNSSMVNLSRLIGPAIAGIAIEKLGDGWCFGLNALSYIAVIGSLLMMRLPKYEPKPRHRSVFGQVSEGFQYIRNEPQIASLIFFLALMSFMVLPFSTLIPVYARDIFHGTASTFGVIDSAIGLGALIGAIFLASLHSGRNLRNILIMNTFVFGGGLILFSHAHHYYLALLYAVVAAFGMMSQITITNTLVQTTVAPEMRGRAISMYAMAFFGFQPFGGLLVGFVSHRIGVQNTVMAEGAVAFIVGALHLRFVQRHRIREKEFATVEQQPVEETIQP
jgi:MFS family permease